MIKSTLNHTNTVRTVNYPLSLRTEIFSPQWIPLWKHQLNIASRFIVEKNKTKEQTQETSLCSCLKTWFKHILNRSYRPCPSPPFPEECTRTTIYRRATGWRKVRSGLCIQEIKQTRTLQLWNENRERCVSLKMLNKLQLFSNSHSTRIRMYH